MVIYNHHTAITVSGEWVWGSVEMLLSSSQQRQEEEKEAGKELDYNKEVHTKGEENDKKFQYVKEYEENRKIFVPWRGFIMTTKMTMIKALIP